MQPTTQTNSALDALVNLLDLEKLEENLFRGQSPAYGWQRVYGGQVLGQALVAAGRTVDTDRAATSWFYFAALSLGVCQRPARR